VEAGSAADSMVAGVLPEADSTEAALAAAAMAAASAGVGTGVDIAKSNASSKAVLYGPQPDRRGRVV